jgi:hypothetical protein
MAERVYARPSKVVNCLISIKKSLFARYLVYLEVYINFIKYKGIVFDLLICLEMKKVSLKCAI